MVAPDPASDPIGQQLRQHGSTLTPQRRTILRFLQGNADHPSAAEICEVVCTKGQKEGQKDHPGAISRATVYNSLALFESLGLLCTVRDAQGALRYDPNTLPHHHRCCPACGRLEDVPLGEVQLTFRGQPAAGVVCFEGRCPDC
jgi:Fe2+ or Zn2+ uptake regulation protein